MKKRIGLALLAASSSVLAVAHYAGAEPLQLHPAPAGVATIAPALPGLPAQGVLKGTGALSLAKKLQVAKTLGLAVGGDKDFDAPITLNVRTPYAGPHAYMSVYGWSAADPHFDPPETMLKTNDDTGFVMVSFRVDPDRSYLVDCTVEGSSFKVRRSLYKPNGQALSENVATQTVSDHHVTTVVQKDSSPRRVDIRLQPIGAGWWGYVGACEITPMK